MSWTSTPKFDREAEKKRGNFVQTGFKVFLTAPIGVAGLFVILLSGNGTAIAYLGPFAGFWAVMNLVGLIFQAAKSLGATHWEHKRKTDNNEWQD